MDNQGGRMNKHFDKKTLKAALKNLVYYVERNPSLLSDVTMACHYYDDDGDVQRGNITGLELFRAINKTLVNYMDSDDKVYWLSMLAGERKNIIDRAELALPKDKKDPLFAAYERATLDLGEALESIQRDGYSSGSNDYEQ